MVSKNRDVGSSKNLERHISNQLFTPVSVPFAFIGKDLGTLAPRNPLLPPTLVIEIESKSFDIFRRLEPTHSCYLCGIPAREAIY